MGESVELLDPRFKVHDFSAQSRNLFKQLRRVALLQCDIVHSFGPR